jgi:peptide/nickel transport system substrate-binding protein
LTAERALLEANPYYYGQKPYLDKVEFRFYRDYGEIFAAYQRGEVEGISCVLPPDLDRVRQAEGLSLYSTWLSRYTLIFLNLEAPLFQEKEVRQALLWAIDRQRIIDQILDGQGLVVNSPILPNSWAYDEDIPRYDYNPQRAKALLEEAGWVDTDDDGVREKEGVLLEFPLLTNDDPLRVRIIEEIARELAEVGVRIHTQVLGYGVSEILQSRHFAAVLYGWGDLPPDPDLYEMWHSTQATDEGQNYGGFANRDVDELLEQARLINDPIQRRELYRRFQEIFAQEVPALLLYYPIYNYALSERVKGVQLGPLSTPSDRFRTIADWYVNTKRVMVSETLQ